jgi:hypothetical protein
MKKAYSRIIIITVILSISGILTFAQNKDSGQDKYTLLTEPFNLRPLNMHKGQLQINTGYRLGVRTKSYNDAGQKISLDTDGTASVRHSFLLNVKYGILDYIELGAEMNFYKQGVRGKTSNYFSGPDYIVTNELSEFNGFEDLHMHISVSLPFDIDNIDFALSGGLSLPTASHKPDQPDHTYIHHDFQSYTFNYHYNYNNGLGVMTWDAAASLKLSLNKITLLASGSYKVPFEEGESCYWLDSFEEDRFDYEEISYSFLLPGYLTIISEIHYQAISWLDVFAGYDYQKSNGGWFERYENKYAEPEVSTSYISGGVEIQISPNIRLYERAGFSIGGKNADGPFYILTSLSINVFPF